VAVEDISFEVQKGEIFGLLGPNGDGKTSKVEIGKEQTMLITESSVGLLHLDS
jgi:ABC-type Na+ transport system ATPase subunit NatA